MSDPQAIKYGTHSTDPSVRMTPMIKVKALEFSKWQISAWDQFRFADTPSIDSPLSFRYIVKRYYNEHDSEFNPIPESLVFVGTIVDGNGDEILRFDGHASEEECILALQAHHEQHVLSMITEVADGAE